MFFEKIWVLSDVFVRVIDFGFDVLVAESDSYLKRVTDLSICI